MKQININDKLYPEKLKNIKNPPKKLYILGNEKLINNQSIAIIGSRNCTQYGKKFAKIFSEYISSQNICVISGLAKGIDTQAHIGAINNIGKTIAVLGCGFNNIFPKENIGLFKEILNNNGAIISEYEPNTKPSSERFLERNRIVSGLSLGIFVVEAAYRSGTSVTAKLAKQQGKKIFCIPNTIENPKGVGTNKLIKNGAKLVIHPREILLELEIAIDEKNVIQNKANKNHLREIPKEYEKIYNIIAEGKINIEQIYKKSDKSINETNGILTLLEIEEYIKQLPGKEFIINN